MSDEQMGFEIEFDEKTEAYLAWADPELMESKVREFITVTVGDSMEGEWWKGKHAIRILEKAREQFGDLDTFRDPANHDRADQLMRFVGACYIKRGMTWTNRPEWSKGMYADFSPAVTGNDDRSVESMTQSLFARDGARRVMDNMSDARPARSQ
ncbi:hypothetical protein ABIA39_008917 [Nocardia sp. GAS34]|uniref:hypothetical protein n=1 Tax=unclassified Nocardia TaxID=2637762 RepID=UPI003D1D4C97